MRSDDDEVRGGMGLSLADLRDRIAGRWIVRRRGVAVVTGALQLTGHEAREMMALGHPLARFQQACDRLYRRSAAGKLPGWLAELLDEGKPDWMPNSSATRRPPPNFHASSGPT